MPSRRRKPVSVAPTMKFASGAIIKPEVQQEVSPQWYILNVANGKELHAKKLLDLRIDKAGLRSEVLDVVVPTLATSVTRGTRVSPHAKALYPSYCFVYMIMGPKAHTALVGGDYVINFVGRDSGVLNGGGSGLTGARGWVTPIPLSDADVEAFQLRSEAAMKLDDPTLGFTIGEMVEVTEGNHAGERGPVRLVRNGCVNVRLYAYGQRMDLDFDPKMVRKLFEDDFVQTLRATEAANSPAQTPKGFKKRAKEAEGVTMDAAAQAQADKAKRLAKEAKWAERQARLKAMARNNPSVDSSSPDPSWRGGGSSSRWGSDDGGGGGDVDASFFSSDVGGLGGGSGSSQGRQDPAGDFVAAAAAEEELAAKESSFLDELLAVRDVDEVSASSAATPLNQESEAPSSSSSSSSSLEGLTVPQLKEMCRDLGLKVGGTKAVLQQRLEEASEGFVE